jgi:hypothetical protein
MPAVWRAVRVVVVLELALIAALALTTAFRLHIYSPIDERANVSYVAIAADQGRLPVLGRDCVSAAVAAVDRSAIPGPCNAVPHASYEAFEPPLYYLLAVPVFDLGSSYRSRVILLRLLDCALFFAAIALSALFVRRAWPGERSWLILAGVLLVYLWPDMIVRGVTVANTALELPLAQLALYAGWRAWHSPGGRWLVASGALLGLCLLTKLTLVYLVPLFAVLVLARLRARRDLRAVVVASLLPLVLLAPWIAFNEIHYGALTADARARAMQEPYLNPQHVALTAADLPDRFVRLATILPQEFSPASGSGGTLRGAFDLLFKIALIAAILLVAYAAARDREMRGRLWLLAPLIAALLMLTATLLLAGWDIFITRYLDAALPWAAAATALAAVLVFPRRLLVPGLGVAFAGETLIWAHYAANYLI